MDDGAAVLRQGGPVTMPPDMRKMLKISRFIGGAVGIIPEFYRHRGKWRGAA